MQKLFSLCTHSVYWLHCCGVSLSKFNQHWKDMNRLSSAETIAVHWCQCCIQQYTQIFWITLILHDVFTSGYSSQLLCTRFTFTRAGFSFQTFSWHCSIALHSFVCLFVCSSDTSMTDPRYTSHFPGACTYCNHKQGEQHKFWRRHSSQYKSFVLWNKQ